MNGESDHARVAGRLRTRSALATASSMGFGVLVVAACSSEASPEAAPGPEPYEASGPADAAAVGRTDASDGGEPTFAKPEFGSCTCRLASERRSGELAVLATLALARAAVDRRRSRRLPR